jgi:hypothetical protein
MVLPPFQGWFIFCFSTPAFRPGLQSCAALRLLQGGLKAVVLMVLLQGQGPTPRDRLKSAG